MPSCKQMKIRRLALLFIPCLLMASCRLDEGDELIHIQVEAEDALKGILNLDEAALDAVNSLNCFAYNQSTGMLETVSYVNGNRFELALDKKVPHKVFVLANLGDLVETAPVRLSEMADFSCDVPSFDEISSGGIPMCGSTTLSAGARASRISLRRLMSRFFISIRYSDSSLDIDNLKPQTIKVCQAANVFYPFATGGSAARSTAEINYSGDEANLTGGGSTDIELFIPENCQGNLLGSGVLSMDKSLSNPDLEPEKGWMCTYIEVAADKQNGGDGISGDLTYRFFPGNGRTRNFDITGGCSYYIDLVLSWNGMFVEGNWKVVRGNWQDARSLLLSTTPDGTYSKTIYLQLPPGADSHKHYLRFSPLSDGRHAADGWSISRTGNGISASVLSQGSTFATVGISVDSSLGIGTQTLVSYSTPEGKHQASARIYVVEAHIGLDRNEVICRDYDQDVFEVKVISSNVPLHQISVISTDGNLELVSYNGETGTARARWKSPNSGVSRRNASLVFSGLGASAICQVYQLSASTFSLEDEGYAGSGGQSF